MLQGRGGRQSRPGALAAIAVMALALLAGDAHAQARVCRLTPTADGLRRLLQCDGFSVEYEADASVSGPTSGPGGQTIRLSRGAALIEVVPGRGTSFRVLTPRAIASVRGTRFAVDDSARVTSVLVLEGVVEVRRTNEGRVVPLRPGDGVDVDTGSRPLVVKRWPQPRVDALLKRLGR